MTAAPEDRTEVVGRRIGAALLDLVIVVVLAFLLALLIGERETSGGNVRVNVEGAKSLVLLALVLGYYGVAEAMTGQTVGKRLLNVRVARLDGGRASAGQVVVRTLLRIVDGIGFYLVGLISVLVTGDRRQRLGDLAAKTTVVAAAPRRAA